MQKVKLIVEMDHKVTTREIAECTSINQGTVCSILHGELGMRKSCSKVLPKIPSPDQKQMRVELCETWLTEDAEGD